MGNLLGTPGEFYAIVTGDAASRSVALERLQQDAQKNILALAASPAARRGPTAAHEVLLGAGRRLRDAVSAADHAPVMEQLYVSLVALCQLLAGRSFTEDEAMGFAFMHNPKLGLGLWFAAEVKNRLPALRGTELIEVDALLEMYFLSTWRDAADEEE
jgi:hypothetical protein